MIEKVKLNEVAKDLNISGKDLTTLLQQRFGGEAKKPQTVLSGEELNFVMEHYTQQHAVKDFGEYFKLGEKKPAPAAAPKPAEKPADRAAEAERKDKHEKVERDSFSMPASEHKRIKALREALGKDGVLASKSEVLRAGLALLAERDIAEVARLVAALPKVAKGKRARKH